MEVTLGERKSFEKQILRIGEWNHPSAPGGKLKISKDYAKQLVSNFSYSPHVPVTRGHVTYDEADKNPNLVITKNIQELKLKEDGVYARFEVDAAEVDTYNDVSASIDPDYEDHESGKKIGPILKHIAFVQVPYIKKLNPFVALSEKQNYLISLSEISMSDEPIKETELEAPVAEEVVTEVTPEIAPEVIEEVPEKEIVEEPVVPEAPVVEEPVTPTEVVTEVNNSESSEELRAKLQAYEVQLAEYQAKEKKAAAESVYTNLLKQGKIIPTMKDSFIQLAEAGSTEINLGEAKTTVMELVTDLFNKLPKLVSLSEEGFNLESSAIAGVDLSEEAIERRKKVFLKSNPKATQEEIEEDIKKNAEILKKYDK
jgi:hypothetical protein